MYKGKVAALKDLDSMVCSMMSQLARIHVVGATSDSTTCRACPRDRVNATVAGANAKGGKFVSLSTLPCVGHGYRRLIKLKGALLEG